MFELMVFLCRCFKITVSVYMHFDYYLPRGGVDGTIGSEYNRLSYHPDSHKKISSTSLRNHERTDSF